MNRVFSFFKKHLNTWDEISLDETLRLRNNLLMFTSVICGICFALVVLMTVDYNFATALPTLSLPLVSIYLFLRQLFTPSFRLIYAWIFAALGFGMTVFLIWTGGVEGTGVLWLYVPPIIAAMVLPPRSIIIFYCMLMAVLLSLLHTPLQNFISYDYSTPFRICIPISLAFVMVCSYVAEISRHNTHKRLVVASKKLQNSALTDPLTEVFNRRALESHFGDMNEKRPGLAFAMLDLDYFKKVNDSYGHDVGDQVLRHVVKLTRENIPSDAFLYRWGGEEFLLVLKAGDSDGFAKELNNLREKIENSPLVFQEGLNATIKVTVSIGGAYPDNEISIEERIRLADMHLYAAKEKGRNRVVV